MEIIINDLKNINKEEIKIDGLSQIPLIKGDSAYEVAVSLGFTGTEKEWLESMKYDDTKIKNEISNKVEKEKDKGLSSNDFTNEYKNKLDNLNNYDDTEIKNSILNKADKLDLSNYTTKDYVDTQIQNKITEVLEASY